MTMSASSLLRRMTLGSVTEAYDRADDALREVEIVAPDVADMIRTARDLLFAARLRLDDGDDPVLVRHRPRHRRPDPDAARLARDDVGEAMTTSTLSDGARLVLLELDAPPRTPISAAELGELVSMSAASVGAWLRELRTAGLAVPVDVRTLEPLDRVRPGTRALWAPV